MMVVIVVVVGVVVVTGAMLVLMEVCWRKKRRNTTLTDASLARENSTYETFNDHHAAAGDTGRVIIKNETYDPFSDGQDTAGGPTEVTENKFFKPFSYTGGPVGVRTKKTAMKTKSRE